MFWHFIYDEKWKIIEMFVSWAVVGIFYYLDI